MAAIPTDTRDNMQITNAPVAVFCHGKGTFIPKKLKIMVGMGERLRGNHHLPVLIGGTCDRGISGRCHTVSPQTCFTGAVLCGNGQGGGRIAKVPEKARHTEDCRTERPACRRQCAGSGTYIRTFVSVFDRHFTDKMEQPQKRIGGLWEERLKNKSDDLIFQSAI